MDGEQRERMRDLKRWAWRAVPTGGALVVFLIAAGIFLRDDWTAFLLGGLPGLVLAIAILVSHWRYIRRGPFPRLPASMREGRRAPTSPVGRGGSRRYEGGSPARVVRATRPAHCPARGGARGPRRGGERLTSVRNAGEKCARM